MTDDNKLLPAKNAEQQQQEQQIQETDVSNLNDSNNKIPSTNTKENSKTPMCYINELARYNKLHPQYILQNEIGPAHKKTFYVTLKLANGEEYTSQGTSIKKAQQSAAQVALDKTKYPKPPQHNLTKTQRFNNFMNTTNNGLNLWFNNNNNNNNHALPHKTFTPTVHLNALAMKYGLEAKYRFLDSYSNRRYLNYNNYNQPYCSYTNFTSNIHEPFCYPNFNMKMGRFVDNNKKIVTGNNDSVGENSQPEETYTVLLSIANQTYHGEGNTRQMAKHDAAFKALQYLNKFRMQKEHGNRVRKRSSKKQSDEVNKSGDDTATENIESNLNVTREAFLNNLSKTKCEITILQDVAYRSKMSVKYELVQESGPSHMKHYNTRCIFDKYEVVEDGKSKRESKRNAAFKMLEKLDDLKIIDLKTIKIPNSLSTSQNSTTENDQQKKCDLNSETQVSTVVNKRQRNKTNHKRKPKNIDQLNKTNPDYGYGTINPVSRLIQIQQAKKEPEPVYELIEEKIKYRKHHEFTMQVKISETNKCVGVGSSKRLAKQNAAENMLISMGYVLNKTQVPKPVLKTNQSNEQSSGNSNNNTEKRVKFSGISENDDVQKETNTAKTSPSTTQNRNAILLSQFNKLSFSNRHPRGQINSQQISMPNQNTTGNSELQSQYKETLHIAATIAKELLNQAHSETGEMIKIKKIKNNEINEFKNSLNENSDYTDKLSYLAELMNFQVNFHSLSKKDEGISSYVNISILPQTEKPFCGNGKTSLESRNTAALSALKYFADLPLKQQPKSPSPQPSTSNTDQLPAILE